MGAMWDWQARRSVRLGATLVAAAGAALYGRTLALDVVSADNAEFQLVAATLGVAHPPGFPLYTILAHLFARLPLGDLPAVHVNALSVVLAAATLAVVYHAAWHLTRRHAAALVSAATLGVSTTFWAQATVANIRTPTTLFAAVALLLLLRHLDADPDQSRLRPALVAVLALGITHHLSLAFMWLVIAAAALAHDGPGRWRLWLRALPWAALGLLPLLYLPARDAALRRPDALLAYISGSGFAGDFFYFITPGQLAARAGVMLNVLTFQFPPLLLAAMGLGWLWLLRVRRAAGVALGAAFLLHTFITATYRAPQTVEYMLPALVVPVLSVGFGFGRIIDTIDRRLPRLRLTPVIIAGLLLVAAVHARPVADRYASLRALQHGGSGRAVVGPLLADAPPGSVILSNWHWATPLWYLQQVEGRRPDVTVEYVFPRGEPYRDTWQQRLAHHFAAGHDVILTNFHDLTLPERSGESLGAARIFRQARPAALSADFAPLDVTAGAGLRLAGVRAAATTVAAGDELALTVAWSAAAADAPPAFTLFAHVAAGDGRLVAQDDVAVTVDGGAGLVQTVLRPTLRPTTPPGRYTLLIGAYLPDGTPLPLADGAARAPAATVTVTGTAWRPPTQHPRGGPIFGRTPQLTGYDWDNTLPGQWRLYTHWYEPGQGYVTRSADFTDATLPDAVAANPGVAFPRCPRRGCHYVPLGHGIVWIGGTTLAGATAPGPLPLAQTWLAGRPLTVDLAVSVGLVGYEGDSDRWAWQVLDDGVPGLGALPTLKWLAGTRVRDPHAPVVAPQAAAGQRLGATLTVYDAFTLRPVPVLDERLTARAPWIPLGTAVVAP